MKVGVITALAAYFILEGGLAHAQPTTAQRCGLASIVAEVVMGSHQAGVSMVDVMSGIGETFPDIVVMAYSAPRFSTREAKDREVARFRDEIAAACYRGQIEVPDSAFTNSE